MRMILYRIFLVFTFLLLTEHLVLAQTKDSSDAQVSMEAVKQFDPDAFDKYLNDPDFEYGIVKKEQGFSIREWIKKKWNELLGGSKKSFRKLILDVVIFGLMFFAVIALIVHFVRGKESRILLKADQSILSNKLLGRTDSHQSLEAQLAEYKEQEKWNFAVRAIYLLTLGMLAESGYFQLKASKTNLKYLREIKDKQVKDIFKDIVDLFELDWYGGFDINSEEFKYLETKYEGLISILSVTDPGK